MDTGERRLKNGKGKGETLHRTQINADQELVSKVEQDTDSRRWTQIKLREKSVLIRVYLCPISGTRMNADGKKIRIGPQVWVRFSVACGYLAKDVSNELL